VLNLVIAKNEFPNSKNQREVLNPIPPQNGFHNSPRETKSQQAQLNSIHQHGVRKDVKVKMNRKTT